MSSTGFQTKLGIEMSVNELSLADVLRCFLDTYIMMSSFLSAAFGCVYAAWCPGATDVLH